MGVTKRFILASLLSGARLVHSAVDLNGEQVVEPVTKNDPSPISDSEGYFPERFDCPVPCDDYSNLNSWTPYFSVDRLQRCSQPMLLKFSVPQLLDDPSTTILIRGCTLGSAPIAATGNDTAIEVENPKKADDLFEASLDTAPACFASGKEVDGTLKVSTSGNSGNSAQVSKLFDGMQAFFDDADNCDEKFVFSYYNQVVAGAYIGAGLGKPTVKSVFKSLSSPGANRTVAQVCDSGRQAERIFGVSIDASGDLLGVQKTLLGWSKGSCATDADLKQSAGLPSVKIYDIAQKSANSTNSTNSTSTFSSKVASASLSISSGKVSGSASGSTSKSASTSHSDGTLSSTGVSSSSAGRSSSATVTTSSSSSTTSKTSLPARLLRWRNTEPLEKRATCRYVKVESGDGCDSLAKKCGISGSDFMKYNSASGYCSNLKPGDYACCSEGDRYTEPKPDPPKAGSDGTCATYLIADGDSCDALAKKYGITTTDIEKYNKGKTWAWTECKSMLVGYNMCLSDGYPPLPPAQQGAECGPIVPGTTQPTNRSQSMAELNPCPLKACCSNWGFCGPFSAHCDIHAPQGGGPGTKLPEYQSTCISNCGNEIKQNSGAPAAFSRIGYYESWNMDRPCLWLKAKDSNTDGTYTHMHWGFAAIDPNTWKPVINDTFKQWDDFKKLSNMKRIVSFGGWAYSTEAATYNIIRKAIIDNRETFATNLAQFVKDEGIDGIDIDWEYPGAPDIYVNGQAIGQKGDGVAYLRFLTSLKQKLGTDKSVSIAAPASYWYLKAFPIDRIAAVIDYIVYMTYDLHGQWDYGNVNAFDACPSGKCIRSHVNLTETRNSLSIITKAGVPNNKIFVGESSYGRSFHMAVNGCWGPMCDFTGSRAQSDAAPGRCTKTGGYISNAEINEILGKGDGAQTFHDGASNTDIMLYKGDYISYMTPTTKDTRRNDWKGLNFAGSIDWAVDLQAFRSADMDAPPNNAAAGNEGCIVGEDVTLNTADLCAFSCSYDFCPESLCACKVRGTVPSLPPENKDMADIIAWDELDVDANRLCKFACKYGYCPEDTCTKPVIDADDDGVTTVGGPGGGAGFDYEAARQENMKHCLIYKDPKMRDYSVNQCRPMCQATLDQAKEEGRTSNVGCSGFYPLDKPIPWEKPPGTFYEVAPGNCVCDNWLLNEIADTIVEALPMIAQIGCYIIMSSLKFVLDVGANFLTGGAGRVLDAGLDMATTAAQMASYLYPNEQDPEGAFSWWLSPCGGTDLVPDDIKKVFGILNSVADGVSSFKAPKNYPKGSGRKGDSGNPTDRSKPKGGTGRGPNGTGSGNGVTKGKKCKIPAGKSTTRLGVAKNTLRKQSCVNNKTQKDELIITSLTYAANAKPTNVVAACDKKNTQACYHYSSAIRVNPQWATITCHPEAATTAHRLNAAATNSWSSQHNGAGWQDKKNRVAQACDRDENPPAYLRHQNDPAYLNSGVNSKGQLVRWVPAAENQDAGKAWKGACFSPPVKALSDSDFEKRVSAGKNLSPRVPKAGLNQVLADVSVDLRPQFSFGSWGHSAAPARDDGLWDNPCWPKGKTPNDPGFALLTFDPYYKGANPPVDYRAPAP